MNRKRINSHVPKEPVYEESYIVTSKHDGSRRRAKQVKNVNRQRQLEEAEEQHYGEDKWS